jgi:hypothetical protein
LVYEIAGVGMIGREEWKRVIEESGRELKSVA